MLRPASESIGQFIQATIGNPPFEAVRATSAAEARRLLRNTKGVGKQSQRAVRLVVLDLPAPASEFEVLAPHDGRALIIDSRGQGVSLRITSGLVVVISGAACGSITVEGRSEVHVLALRHAETWITAGPDARVVAQAERGALGELAYADARRIQLSSESARFKLRESRKIAS